MKDRAEPATFTAAADRVPRGEKVAYALGTGPDLWGHWLYPAVAYPIFNIALGMPPALVGLALALIRFFDAASDPLFGWLSDNTRTRFGRRRPYILVGSILAGLALPLLYFVPRGSTGSQLFWWMLGSNFLYLPLISCFNMPYQSLGNELTPDYEERTRVMAYKYALSNLFQIANFAALPFTNLGLFFDHRSGKQDILRAIQVYMGLLGLVMAVIGIIIFKNVRERYYGSVAARHQAKVSLRASFYETLKCPPFRTMLLVSLAFTMGTSLLGSLGYYTTVYYVNGGNTATGNNWNGLMGVSYMALGIIGAPTFGWLGRRVGKRIAMFLALAVALAAFGGNWFWFNPAHPWLQLVGTAGGAFGTSGFFMLSASIGADIIDADELATGTRREGAFSACSSWINKAGNASGYFISGAILTLIGFNAQMTGAQSPHTILWMRIFLSVVPVVGIGLAMALLSCLTLTKAQARETRTLLEIRRGEI